MKVISYLFGAAMIAAIGLTANPASAQLLGGVLGGDGGGVVGGLLGGGDSSGGIVDLDTSGDGNIGVPGVVELNVSSNDSGTNANGTVLGGGGSSLDLPLGGLLGGDSGVGVELPDLGGLLPGLDGQPGVPGAPGAPGTPGVNGNGGFAGISGLSGRNGLDGIAGNSSRLRMLLRILENRAGLRFAQGNRVCLPAFGVANVSGWVRPREYGALQRMLAAYGSDIATLQSMMARCRKGQQRALDLSRVIGVDLRRDGTVVVMTM